MSAEVYKHLIERKETVPAAEVHGVVEAGDSVDHQNRHIDFSMQELSVTVFEPH
jgi:hypothetical protein